VILLVPTQPILAKQLSYKNDIIKVAKVIDIIDGEVIKVWYYYTDFNMNEVQMIKMIGIDTNANQEAYELSLNSLLGSTVYIVEDDYSDTFPSVNNLDCEYAYVFRSYYQTFNEELLLAGLAEVNEAYVNAVGYSDLVEAQRIAKLNEVGIWDTGTDTAEPIININVASYDALSEVIEDSSYDLITQIMEYREENPFNSLEEIKYVSSTFDYDWFEANQDNLSVVTNINSANKNELMTLFPNSYTAVDLAESIIDYRIFNNFDSVEEIKDVLSAVPYYSTFYEYISLASNQYYEETDKKVANINTCNLVDFEEATDLSDEAYNSLFTYRSVNEYTIKSINELTVDNNPLDYSYYYEFMDDLSVFTDINNANEFELKSLFGSTYGLSDSDKEDLAEQIIANRPYIDISDLKKVIGSYYDNISPYIYAYTSKTQEYININTADPEYVAEYLGLSNDEAEDYIEYREDYDYDEPSDIDFDLTDIGDKISLYTNVNTASYFELVHLHEEMTEDIANAIISLRNEQVIAHGEEIEALFEDYDESEIYSDIEDYLVFF
jgi:DNA uptake protein ComE-like DNA-binding protein